MIEFESVTKEFGEGTVAVAELDLLIPSDRVTVLVGSSGSGKTTILRMVNRMVDPTRGRVMIDGVDVAGMAPVALRRRIGYVMQSAGLLPHRRVLDNVITVLRLTGMPKAAARRRGIALMATVGLDARLAQRYPSQLSGGQQQRVGVARALASDPNILLMDEPFGAVDPIVRLELQDELLRLQQQRARTVVFVTHDIDEAFRIGDEVVILSEGGHIEQRGTPTQLLAAPASEFVAEFIGVHRGRRSLRVVEQNGNRVVVDATGRPAGVLRDGQSEVGRL